MNFQRTTLETCSSASGTVVIIDVLRAFSTAAYALAAGAERILLVSKVEEALALRDQIPGALALGEVGGLPIPGFDLSNSPTELDLAIQAGLDLHGITLIQRTSAGTQGVVRSGQADFILASSFVVAGATIRGIQQLAQDKVTFVITGTHGRAFQELQTGDRGDEDAALADYLECRLRGETPDPQPYLQRVRLSEPGQLFADPGQPVFPASDLDYCTAVDRFDFSLPVERQAGLLVMRAVAI